MTALITAVKNLSQDLGVLCERKHLSPYYFDDPVKRSKMGWFRKKFAGQTRKT
jgi:hypothetical protein